MEKKVLVFVFLAFGLLCLNSCIICDDCINDCNSCGNCVKGRGGIISRELHLDPFHSFTIPGSAKVILTQGESQKVIVEGQSNIIDLIELRITNGNWHIGYEECIEDYDELVYYITIPEIRSMGVAGSGSIETNGLITGEVLEIKIGGSGNVQVVGNFDEIHGEISGSGNITLSGVAFYEEFDIAGSGNIYSYDLIAREADIRIAGSGDAKVNVAALLEVQITGSGNVYYKGNPEIDVSIVGSGNLINKD